MKIRIQSAELEQICSQLDRRSIPYSMVRFNLPDRPPYWVLDVEGHPLATVHLRDETPTHIFLNLNSYVQIATYKENA